MTDDVRDLVVQLAPDPATGSARAEDRLVEDLGYHSLALLELAAMLEERYGLPRITREQASELLTVGAVERHVARHRAGWTPQFEAMLRPYLPALSATSPSNRTRPCRSWASTPSARWRSWSRSRNARAPARRRPHRRRPARHGRIPVELDRRPYTRRIGAPMSGSMLVTGATGVLGAEVVRQAAGAGWDVTGVSRRGGDGPVVAWRMGQEPAPRALRRPWDAIVHAAADTRWNLPAADALAANLDPTRALAEVAGPDTFVVHVSTFFATGIRGDGTSDRLADYRNSYEWAKAATERHVRGTYPNSVIVRPPMIVGRADDGTIARFNGIYTVLGAATAGLLAVVLGDPSARVEIVPVDAVADLVVRLAADRAAAAAVRVLGAAGDCLTLREIIDGAFGAMNTWRGERGIDPVAVPPFVSAEQWERFYLPFSRPHLGERQLAAIELLDAFRDYFTASVAQPVTDRVTGVADALAVSVRYWADTRPLVASRTPRPWSTRSAAGQRV